MSDHPAIRFVCRLFFGLALALLFLSHAQAQTVTIFTSAAGIVQWKNDSGTGIVSLPYDGSGPPAIDGASTVTWQQGSSAPVGVTTYSALYNGNLAGATGSIQLQCDDSCTVALNGVQIGSTTPDQWNTVQTIAIPAGIYINGTNALSIDVTNTTGYTGVAFLATATPPPAPVLNNCPVAPFNANPAIPATPANCALPAGAVKVGDDGTVVTVLLVGAPVQMIYCATAPGTSTPVCNRPIIEGARDPFLIGPTALLGGPPIAPAATSTATSGTASATPPDTPLGSLYFLPGLREVTLTTAVPGPPITIPAATPK